MKNLSLWNVSLRKLDNHYSKCFALCHGQSVNGENELFSCTHNLNIIKFNDQGETLWSKDLSGDVSLENEPIYISYLSLVNKLCVGFQNGEIITVSDTGTNISLAGYCDSGLLAMEWSPDQDLLVLITKDMNTILMSYTFDPIHEENLLSNEFGEKQFITVGWGKKETQFHGSEGKRAATIKQEVLSDPEADNQIKITWRGDSSLFAVGFSMDGIRRFKVFDREGNLQYTSEKQQGLEANICWRPSGNLIATTQKQQQTQSVAFFEKNGLKHGGFDLTLKSDDKVVDLYWSADSEILAVKCLNVEDDTQKILLFTTSNYHWYLKQTLTFTKKQKLIEIIWDNDFDNSNSKKLHVILQNGDYFTYTWILNIDHSKGKQSNDNGIVGVVDGNKLLLTGFRQTIVPPPMSALEMDFGDPVCSVNFAPGMDDNIESNSFFVALDNKLVFCKQIETHPLNYASVKHFALEEFDFPYQYYNWYWINNATIACVSVSQAGSYNLVQYCVTDDSLVKQYTVPLPEAVLGIQSHPKNNSCIFLELSNGDILKYEINGEIEPTEVSFEKSCLKFDVILIDDDQHFLGLSQNGNFYIDNEMILKNVNSYFLHSHFLLLTTLEHVLFCVELKNAGLNGIKEYQKKESEYVYKRKLERGSKLVISIPNDTRTILQMPRGNLEVIQPRPLSLKIIGTYLDSFKYHEAFDLMRKQRINLNLFYDHNPQMFECNIETFIESISNNSWLNLFLSDLENIDVTETMYASSYADKNCKSKTNTKCKVNKICELIRENLLKRTDSDSKILPLITTYIKNNTIEDLENALVIINKLKKQELSGSKLPVGSDEALKYLLYMVDVNHVFNVALGMYDFDLVLLVANKTQKDPKEYIHMLNEFNSMEDNLKKFSINKHLKRFDRAVEFLAKCGPDKYNELRTFVKYHSLYREALKFFSPNDDIFKEISDDFALFLKLNKQFTQAGIIYERSHNFDKAIECYKEALEWELAIKLALMWPENKLKELCGELVTVLEQERRHQEALTILEQYYKDPTRAINYAVDNGQYKSALRLCAQYNSELKDTHLIPTLLEEYKNLDDLIESNRNTFVQQRDRLAVVKEIKINNDVEPFDDCFANKDSDLYSDAGSTVASSTSRSSSRTFRSSKNRRKHERKMASLKEGSQFEDVALLRALHNLVTSSFAMRRQVREINVALCVIDKEAEAYRLQTNMEKLLKEMKESFPSIWTNELVLEATKATVAAFNLPEGHNVLQGIASLEPNKRISPVVEDIHWKISGLN